MKTNTRVINLSALSAFAVAFAAGGTALANLGSFEPADGYGGFLNEVRQTNEGQYGTANGGPGGPQVAITPGSGLWYGITGTMYPAFGSGGQTAYATGHGGYQHTGTQGLVITTGCDGWAGPALKYGYRVDSRDLGGVSPGATAGQTITMSFWTRTDLQGTGEGGGVVPGTTGDSVSFVDALGNVGFSVGVTQPSTTTDFVSFINGVNIVTPIVAGAYSRWDITLNLATQTVSASYFDGFTSILTPLLVSAPLATPMSNLDRLYFESSSGVSNSKNWAVDDFSFRTTVPAPGAGVLLGVGAVGLTSRRRRVR